MGGTARAALRVARLPPGERRCACEAAAELVRASVELHAVPRRRTAAFLGRLGGVPRADDGATADAVREAVRVGRTVALVAHRLPWRPSCLRQAVAVQRMLRRRGITAHMRLGIGRDGGRAVAHAWVTVGERTVVGGEDLGRFVGLAAF